MPKKIGRKNRISVTKTFSFPPAVAEFISERSLKAASESDYLKRLVEFDREHNILADSFREHADSLAAK